TVRVRCISGCLTGRPRAGAWSPTTFINNSGSIFASAAGSSGGNSTTRITLPLSGGDRPIGFAAASAFENPGGEESVIHRLTEGGRDAGALSVSWLSNNTIALLPASIPVTTRRISDAPAAEQANRTTALGHAILRIIASSLVYVGRRGYSAKASHGPLELAGRQVDWLIGAVGSPRGYPTLSFSATRRAK